MSISPELPMLDGPSYPTPSVNPSMLVILLHGYGSDGNDLISLAPFFQQYLPKAHFLAPNAPYPCEHNDHGYQWFGLNILDPFMLMPAARHTATYIERYIESKSKIFNIPYHHIALAGFSQGAMMALHVGLRQRQQLGGIISFSGALIGTHLIRQELASFPPVLLIHGTEDMVVPFHESQRAHRALHDAGVQAELLSRPNLGHTIDEAGLKKTAQFLQQHLVNPK